jgi:DNA-binding transcriptional LysR family regulator
LFAPLNRPPQIAEEHDSATSLIASVEAGRGVALVLEPFKCFAPRVKICALVPPPPPLVISIASRKETNSPAVASFIVTAKRVKRIENKRPQST